MPHLAPNALPVRLVAGFAPALAGALLAGATLLACSNDDDPAPGGSDAAVAEGGDAGVAPEGGGATDGGGGAEAGGGGGGACGDLCRGGGFSGGTATDFGQKVVECQCAGTGTGLQKPACEAYCAPLGVSAPNALLSSEASPNDKCVCDGTQEP